MDWDGNLQILIYMKFHPQQKVETGEAVWTFSVSPTLHKYFISESVKLQVTEIQSKELIGQFKSL